MQTCHFLLMLLRIVELETIEWLLLRSMQKQFDAVNSEVFYSLCGCFFVNDQWQSFLAICVISNDLLRASCLMMTSCR